VLILAGIGYWAYMALETGPGVPNGVPNAVNGTMVPPAGAGTAYPAGGNGNGTGDMQNNNLAPSTSPSNVPQPGNTGTINNNGGGNGGGANSGGNGGQ